MTLTTATGKTFEFKYVGVSMMDGRLYFTLENAEFGAVVTAFSDPHECKELKFHIDEMSDDRVYFNYTRLNSIIRDAAGDTITLGMEQERRV